MMCFRNHGILPSLFRMQNFDPWHFAVPLVSASVGSPTDDALEVIESHFISLKRIGMTSDREPENERTAEVVACLTSTCRLALRTAASHMFELNGRLAVRLPLETN
jgi:hypothetical protein